MADPTTALPPTHADLVRESDARTADAINASLDANRHAILRQQFATGTVKHWCGPDATFDEIPGGMLARRDDRVALMVIREGEYGS